MKLTKSIKKSEPIDYCIYIDTDSLFFSALPIIKKEMPDVDVTDDEQMSTNTIKIAEVVKNKLNSGYDVIAKRMFNISSDNHRLNIKQEVVSKCSIFVAKKRYVQWIINEGGLSCDTIEVKGLDVIRSSFPSRFRQFMLDMESKTGIIADFLFGVDKSIIDEKILKFKRDISTFPVDEVARNTSIKDISKFWNLKSPDKQIKFADLVLGNFPKVFKKEDGNAMPFPSHVKACINFNKLLKLKGLDKMTEPMFNGEKIKYVYLKQNEYGIEELAFRGYHDPQYVMDFIDKYYDGMLLYDRELKKKIDDFYDAMKWTPATESDKIIDSYFAAGKDVPYHKHEKVKRQKEKLEENEEVTNEFFSF